MLPQNNPDRIRIVFDDHRLVANAGLLLPATLAQHLGLRELVDRHLDPGGAPGRANTGDKLLTLVASALAGGDCIFAKKPQLIQHPCPYLSSQLFSVPPFYHWDAYSGLTPVNSQPAHPAFMPSPML